MYYNINIIQGEKTMLSVIFSLLISSAHANEIKYSWQWETSPAIEICPDSSMTVNEVAKSISYWESQGVEVDITSIQHVNKCDLSKRNVIQIMGDRGVNHSKEFAKTKVKWYYYGQKNPNTTLYIKSAHIQIPNNNLKLEHIVLHEIGHSLGLGHSHHNVMKAIH
jgi:predicted Zn-dependent protease